MSSAVSGDTRRLIPLVLVVSLLEACRGGESGVKEAVRHLESFLSIDFGGCEANASLRCHRIAGDGGRSGRYAGCSLAATWANNL
jgi:hypothetical protein